MAANHCAIAGVAPKGMTPGGMTPEGMTPGEFTGGMARFERAGWSFIPRVYLGLGREGYRVARARDVEHREKRHSAGSSLIEYFMISMG